MPVAFVVDLDEQVGSLLLEFFKVALILNLERQEVLPLLVELVFQIFNAVEVVFNVPCY